MLTVSEPVGGGGDRGLLGTGPQGEGLSDDDPAEGTPGGSKGRNKHAGRDNHEDASPAVIHGIHGNTGTGEDNHPGTLPEPADDHGPPATELLDEVQTREGHGDVDSSQDELYHDGILDARRLEDRSTIVEEEVRSGPLLQELECHAEERPVDLLGDARLPREETL